MTGPLRNLVVSRFPKGLSRQVDDANLASFRIAELFQKEASVELLENGVLSLCCVPPNGPLSQDKQHRIDDWIHHLIRDSSTGQIKNDPLFAEEYTVNLMGHDGDSLVLLENVYPKGGTFSMSGISAIFFDFNVGYVRRYPFA